MIPLIPIEAQRLYPSSSQRPNSRQRNFGRLFLDAEWPGRCPSRVKSWRGHV